MPTEQSWYRDAVELRHLNVQDNHGRTQAFRQFDCLHSISRASNAKSFESEKIRLHCARVVMVICVEYQWWLWGLRQRIGTCLTFRHRGRPFQRRETVLSALMS